MIDVATLRLIMPRAEALTLERSTPCILASLYEADVSTVTRAAAFLAQWAHESGELRYMEEQGDDAYFARYDGRKDLGNDQPGDGRRYKGRGPPQLTGRANYRAAGAALGIDLENQPNVAALPEVGWRVAGWYWTTRNINALADALDFRAITHAINGGFNGLDQRLEYYYRALAAIGRDVKIDLPRPGP